MIAAEPPEWFFLYKRLFIVFNSPMHGLLAQGPDVLVVLPFFNRDCTPELKFPGGFGSGWIIFDMFYITSSFKYQRFYSFITKFFGSPTAAGARANHDNLVGPVFFIVRHGFERLHQYIRNNDRVLLYSENGSA